MSHHGFHPLITAAALLLSCTSPSPCDAHAGKWPFEIKGSLGDSDAHAIVALVQSRSGLVSKRIWQIEVTKPGSVEVALGYPERHGGELLQLEKRRGHWAIVY